MPKYPRFNPSPWRNGWRIMLPPSFSPSGRRSQVYFENKTEALGGQKMLLAALKEQGEGHPFFTKTASDILLEELQSVAQQVGLSVKEAVEEAVAARRASSSVSLADLAAGYLDSLSDKSPAHRKAAVRIVSSLCDFIGDMVVDSISPLEFEAWLERVASSSPYNWNLHVAHAKALFSWGIRRRLCKVAPSDAVKKMRIAVDEIRILSPAEAQVIIDVCVEHAPDALLAWAILMFAGVRPDELRRLALSDINLQERVIKISSKVSKTKTMRLIHIEDNLFSLLQSWEHSFITPPNWERKYKMVRKLSGISEFKDICRHSYASYHYGKYRDMGLLLENMGHATQQMTLKHYKTPPKPSDIAKYWGLLSGENP